ncbi:unnamed protein product [Rotaria sordida]|uniref:F-box domain-containing protein n=1 Tax=Rotaria sordida TaxID=392033 RepID=A0A813UHR8_9BILA|nr:unnamed protein product [Rotaria sordida]CAF0953600.1 unnamed protein product [Rotaria sordida]
MNQAKRQMSVDMSYEEDTKKLRTSNEDKFINCFENLSNELFYEIFDYLDGRDIFYGFSNLNIHFESLIMNSRLLLKIHDYTSYKQSFEHDYQRIILPNKHRIFSLHLLNGSQLIRYSTFHTFDSSFYRLESLILHGIKFNEIILFLPNLTNLPRLFSLNIHLDDVLDDSNRIYHLIFRLPMLKYNKLSVNKIILQDSISSISNEHFSSIKQLVINYPCTLYNLYNILSYTSKLHHLTCEPLFSINENISREIPLKLFNLTYCSISQCYLKFNEFEIFIKQISSQLRILRFKPCSDIFYLDADRWQQLILQYMPYLHTFQFKYHDGISDHFEIQSYHSFLNRFISPFWIERQWLLDIQIDLNHWPPVEIIFSIQPKRKQWNELLISYERNNVTFNQITDVNLSDQEYMHILNSMSQLTVRNCRFIQYDQWFIDCIHFISSLAEITCLYIEFQYFSIDIIIQFLYRLPHLNSLTIVIMFSNQKIQLTEEQINMIHTISNMNQIIKMNIEQIFELNQIDILINLCPRMKYLNVQCKNYIDLEYIIRLILMKKNSNLYFLCFSIPNADERMVKRLQTMIDLKELLVNYTIQHCHNKIYLQRQKY